MKLLITFTAHAVEFEGKYYNCSKALVNYEHLCRYKQHIKDVVVVLRCRKSDRIDPSWPRIDGEGITVMPIPDPASPLKALLMLPRIIMDIFRAVGKCDRYLLKMPEPTATVVGLVLVMLRKKYSVEVVANAQQGILYAKGDMPFVRFYAWLFDKATKVLAKRAMSATYVSQYLRKRYPTKAGKREWVICSVEFDKDMTGDARPVESFEKDTFSLISVGRMSAEKGHLYLVRAFKKIHDQCKKDVRLHLVGDGPERDKLENETKSLGLSEAVHFHGYVKRGAELFSLIDRADLFVMPSLTEGMGRGLIEAMARGIPCIGSSVGGIPEFLPESALFASGDPGAISDKVLQLFNQPDRLASMSLNNLEVTRKFQPEASKAVKKAFWDSVLHECK